MKVALLLLLHPVSSSISGYHVDDETCSGLVYNNATKQREICPVYFQKLADTSSEMRNLSARFKRQQPFKLSVDAGVGWVCPQVQPCHPPYCDCINITFQGSTKSVAKHVVDLADEVVLMDYKLTAQQVYQNAVKYLQYADASRASQRELTTSGALVKSGSPSPASIRVGLAIASPSGKQPFEVATEAQLASLMVSAETLLGAHPSFTGFAVFGAWWYELSLENPSPPGTTWPNNTGMWYSNHSLILGPTKARDAFLAWAGSRGITEMYIAPHAVPPLVEGASGGNSTSSQKFCEFLRVASEKYALDVQFFSGAYADDEAFFKACAYA